MHIACCMTKATNTHWQYITIIAFSTATLVTRTRLNVTLYVHCLPYVNLRLYIVNKILIFIWNSKLFTTRLFRFFAVSVFLCVSSTLSFFSSLAVSHLITYRSYIQTIFLSSFLFWFSFLQLVFFSFTFHLIRKGSYDTFLNSQCCFFLHVWLHVPQPLPSAMCFCAVQQ